MKKLIKKLFLLAIVLGSLFVTIATNKHQTVGAYTPPNLKKYQQVDTEFRAVWVATVYNLDIPRIKGTSEEAINTWKNYYLSILDNAQAANMNAIIFQIRPCNDAFYPSKYNPWSEYLYSYGQNPGFDPLEWMIKVTHERGMEYHAWMNPYRASVTSEKNIVSKSGTTRSVIDYDDNALQEYKKSYFGSLKAKGETAYDGTKIDNPVFATGDELVHNVVLGTEEKFVLNPALDETIEHLEKTIREVIENYEIDGIHFDDYFYPYTATYSSVGSNTNFKGKSFSTEPIIDYADYQTYKKNGGNLSIYDWRRENINHLIENLSIMINGLNANKTRPCAFGISPAGRWAPSIESCPAGSERGAVGGMSGSCNNYYSYSDLYADTKKWVDEEWVDYILPQVYSQLGGSYEEVVKWWSQAMVNSPVKLYIGSPLYQHDEWNTNSEVYNQIRYNQSEGYRVNGYSMYDYTSMTKGKGQNGIKDIRKYLWKYNALTPVYDKYNYSSSVSGLAKEQVIKKNDESTLRIEYNLINDAKGYGLYKFDTEDITDLSNYTPDKLVALNLQGCDFFELMNYDATMNYVIVTYSMDNTFNLGAKVDFGNIVENKPPVIEIIESPIEVLIEEEIIIKFKVTDLDNDSLIYKIYLVNGSNVSLIEEKNITNEEVIVKIKGYFVPMRDLSFKIVASDGRIETVLESTKFNVVETCTNHIPNGEATCTKSSKCVKCGTIIEKALGHSQSEWIIDVEATCTTTGSRHKDCTRCHVIISEEAINMLDHLESKVIIDSVPSCKNEGESHTECLNCHQILNTITNPKLEHVESDWIIDSGANCKEEGLQHKECNLCGEKLVEEAIEKNNHTWIDATTESPKTCSVCGATEGDKLPAPSKKKWCKKDSILTIMSMIMIVTSAVIIIRKRNK